MNVLVVDDSSVMRRIHQRSLEGLGWQVSTAEDGVQALEVLRQMGACHLVVTDLHMPNMDGLGLAQAVRQGKQHAQVKILMVTSDGVMESVQRALAAGVDDILIKPFSPEAFAAKVRSVAGE